MAGGPPAPLVLDAQMYRAEQGTKAGTTCWGDWLLDSTIYWDGAASMAISVLSPSATSSEGSGPV